MDYLMHHGVLGMKWGVRKDTRLASSIHKKAIKKEPKITKDIKDAISKTDALSYGLENRLKTEESIDRKLKTGKMDIKDAVRYTAVSNDNNFVSNYKKIKKSLLKKKDIEKQDAKTIGNYILKVLSSINLYSQHLLIKMVIILKSNSRHIVAKMQKIRNFHYMKKLEIQKQRKNVKNI